MNAIKEGKNDKLESLLLHECVDYTKQKRIGIAYSFSPLFRSFKVLPRHRNQNLEKKRNGRSFHKTVAYNPFQPIMIALDQILMAVEMSN
jgi:hypothetical protein